MIISASRRTDIPAFYAKWFANRIRAGYCTVPNPFNRNQVSRISLRPVDVDAIVFWTRNPRPLLPLLPELNKLGYKYYFQFTLMDNPRAIDVSGPAIENSIKTFQQLSTDLADPRRVVWRYDPIVLSSATPVDFHLETYRRIAEQLKGYSVRSVISVVDQYAKAKKRIQQVTSQGIRLETFPERHPDFDRLIRGISEIASSNGFQIQSCAEEIDLDPLGVPAGKCIDDVYLEQIFGLDVSHNKDKGQREACGCVQSRDIGMYDTCLFGCAYCYATTSFDTARRNHEAHDSDSPSIVGHYETPPAPDDAEDNRQLKLL